MKCLKVTPSRIQRALKSVAQNPSADEARGRALFKNKTSDLDRQNIINFISLFPKYESHYSRKKSQKKYLHPNLNLIKLYGEYKNSCEFKKQNVVSHYVFREIFNNSFNLSFKRTHTDTCKTCDHLKCSLKASVQQNEIEKVKDAQKLHLLSVEKVCSEIKLDVESSIQSGNTAVLTFDLQKTLETPSLTTSVAYYRRQLWTYNLCVYDEVQKKGKYCL